jgi:hypothetical protein
MSFSTSEFVQDATCCLVSIFVFLLQSLGYWLAKSGFKYHLTKLLIGGTSIALLLQSRRGDFRLLAIFS